nr:sugar nucleotide-binding protein [Alkalihalobacterium alkalinitrilicum]
MRILITGANGQLGKDLTKIVKKKSKYYSLRKRSARHY